jgi:thiamine biosynthesis lipoprotein
MGFTKMGSTSFHAMGSRISIAVQDNGPGVDEFLLRARRWFLAWEACFSRFDPHSELSRLNRGEVEGVSCELWSLLRAALRAEDITGGLVTPCVLDALEAAGYDRSFERVGAGPPLAGSEPVPAAGGEIYLEPARRRVRLPAGKRLDLGGFGKGWAADRCARRLGKFTSTLVDAGGDIAVSAPRPDGQPWRIAIAHPTQPGRSLAVLPLLYGGVATSGRNLRRWSQAGQPHHHLIDPRTGRPAETDVMSASVLAPTALEAETAAKAALILGSRAGLAWLEARPRLAGILVLEDGRVLPSPALSPYILPVG